jgi:hypothetical protein
MLESTGSAMGTTSQKVIPLLVREDLKSDFMKILELKGPKHPNKDDMLSCSPSAHRDINFSKIGDTPITLPNHAQSMLSSKVGPLIRR